MSKRVKEFKMDKVRILHVTDEAAFEFVANILRDAGIPFYKMSADAGGAYAGSIGGIIEIFVDNENESKAKEVLSGYDLK